MELLDRVSDRMNVRILRKANWDNVRNSHHVSIDRVCEFFPEVRDLPLIDADWLFDGAFPFMEFMLTSFDRKDVPQNFVLRSNRGLLLVDTQGYDYCRYVIPLTE